MVAIKTSDIDFIIQVFKRVDLLHHVYMTDYGMLFRMHCDTDDISDCEDELNFYRRLLSYHNITLDCLNVEHDYFSAKIILNKSNG